MKRDFCDSGDSTAGDGVERTIPKGGRVRRKQHREE